MTKKLGIFDVNNLVSGGARRLTIKKALTTVVSQMRAAKMAERTISDYQRHAQSYVSATELTYLDEVDVASIYVWLASMNVSNNTLLIRLKCFKAFLGRCFDNGWIERKFWRTVTVKTEQVVKQGAAEENVAQLLSVMDTATFIGLRDAVALLTMYRAGLRVGSLVSVKESDIDTASNTITLQGAQLKNRKGLILPLPLELVEMIEVLIERNEAIRAHYGEENAFLFINRNGTRISSELRHNTIQRRLRTYSQKHNIDNINPHALRRGFAKQLLERGADLALISKALGHSNLAVTTQYLHFESQEIVDKLRGYL
ncbi:tyrosine-type recombinase/integrase [Paenilisteria rocourtiae]|uniref:Site-specific recombinase XerD n=1 Tax=Listeria rocourtiae TaxID=647910 RepID=A0A4V3DQ76_9LIST|nr:tyrosine-type recombinase/integrase [Listeria rocourtiae]EUJ44394.1 integrase/recombinase [Listeria rocourtiae FSL F6-920]TDR55126.1 site-specific recombinase XerD [Listeria rocourtiae]